MFSTSPHQSLFTTLVLLSFYYRDGQVRTFKDDDENRTELDYSQLIDGAFLDNVFSRLWVHFASTPISRKNIYLSIVLRVYILTSTSVTNNLTNISNSLPPLTPRPDVHTSNEAGWPEGEKNKKYKRMREGWDLKAITLIFFCVVLLF